MVDDENVSGESFDIGQVSSPDTGQVPSPDAGQVSSPDTGQVPSPDAGQVPSALQPKAIGPDLIVITGMSGAGRTEAMHTFEDLGYFCIDNLPPSLIMNLVTLAGIQSGSQRKLAVVCDLRGKEFFPELTDELKHLDGIGVTHALLFLDATDEALLRRYKANRRRHPLCVDGMPVIAGIKKEREMLVDAREMANYVIDTSSIRAQDLRKDIRDLFMSGMSEADGLSINIFSFGFKHGMPEDADIIIDVRFLPNPFYIPELRALTGLDTPVADYVLGKPETVAFLGAWFNLLDTVMPGYVAEGKQHLSIGMGCTGGQHRSVVLAVKTGEYLADKGYHVMTVHRDIALAEVSS